jgi:hypothetical protein
MADDRIFEQQSFVVAHAADFVGGRFQVLVGHQHDIDFAFRFD